MSYAPVGSWVKITGMGLNLAKDWNVDLNKAYLVEKAREYDSYFHDIRTVVRFNKNIWWACYPDVELAVPPESEWWE